MVVQLVLARMQSGITEASVTRSPSMPRTRQRWSTTASGSSSVPILQVPEMCCEVVTLRSSQLSSVSSVSKSAASGSISRLTMP